MMTVKKTKAHADGAPQKPKSWDDFFASPVRVTEDFMVEREQPKDQERGDDDDFMEEGPELLNDDRLTL